MSPVTPLIPPFRYYPLPLIPVPHGKHNEWDPGSSRASNHHLMLVDSVYKRNPAVIFEPIEASVPHGTTRRKWIALGSSIVIAAGIVLGSYSYLPAAQFSLQQTAGSHPALQKLLPSALKAPDLAAPLTGNWLIIPSINVKEQIWDGASLDVLWKHEGVWHQVGDKDHNLVLAGHRFQYLPPNTHTFYNLDKLRTGDEITLVWNGVPIKYLVTGSQVVTPDHVEILNQTSFPELTLYTCNDWATTHRLVVVAKPV